MSQYVYIKSEPYLYTVGFYNDGKWNTDSDHDTKDEAAKRVSYLNGNHSAYNNELVKALKEFLRVINRTDAALFHYDVAIKMGEAALHKVNANT